MERKRRRKDNRKRTRGTREVVVLEKPKEETPIEACDYDAVKRMQEYPDFHSMLEPKSLTNMLGYFYSLGRDKLERMIDDPRTTIGELQAIVLSTDAFDSESTSRMRSKEYIDSRLFGKVPDKVEYTGADGGAIKMETKEQNFEAFLKTASREEIEKLKEVNDMFIKEENE